jgi:hypothetical protein
MSEKITKMYFTHEPVYFASEPMQIGKHEWRVLVCEDQFYGPCTFWQWRRLQPRTSWERCVCDGWQEYRDWPTYNFNDGSYSGLPKTLRRLYDANEWAIKVALKRIVPTPEPDLLSEKESAA